MNVGLFFAFAVVRLMLTSILGCTAGPALCCAFVFAAAALRSNLSPVSFFSISFSLSRVHTALPDVEEGDFLELEGWEDEFAGVEKDGSARGEDWPPNPVYPLSNTQET
jgi:hypothetical protein